MELNECMFDRECESFMETDSYRNGITGRKFTDKTNRNSIFLPAPGYRSSFDGKPFNAGTLGNYWSSTTSGNFSYYLYFSSNLADWNFVGRHYGRYVRAVAETQ